MKDRWMLGKYPPLGELEHFKKCSGCGRCDYIMNYYGQCSICENIIDKEYLHYDHPTGDYYCDDCAEFLPIKHGVEFGLCVGCGERFLREKMIFHHNNFTDGWACSSCIYSSSIQNRWEILIL